MESSGSTVEYQVDDVEASFIAVDSLAALLEASGRLGKGFMGLQHPHLCCRTYAKYGSHLLMVADHGLQ